MENVEAIARQLQQLPEQLKEPPKEYHQRLTDKLQEFKQELQPM